ncbi:MAG: hypothetical protein GC155_03775 [Alphaproteobacteria bacterium]|nr:hypothetical protein [Alphaproteobacteria bacterium]
MRTTPALITGLMLALSMPAVAQTPRLAVGQVWTFKDAPSKESRVVIRKLEKIDGEDVVHLSVHGVPFVRAGNGLIGGVIGHEPFEQQAFLASIDKLTAEPRPADPLFAEGYKQWHDAHGGVYTISVAQSIELMRQTVQKSHAP